MRHHVRCWGPDDAPPVVLLHGWMDSAASFQFLVDAFEQERRVYGLDWRGYGYSDRGAGDCYWFPDYLADLEAVLDAVSPAAPVDLVAHSMGGNVACMYAGIRPERVRRLVNLEGYGLPGSRPEQAPGRYAKWLDALRTQRPERLWPSTQALAARLRAKIMRLDVARAEWLAQNWMRSAVLEDAQGPQEGWQLLADPAHKLTNPVLYRLEEVLACWRQITAPVLLVESGEPDEWHRFTRTPEYRERLKNFASLQTVVVAQSGHMLHHDQPTILAALIEEFFGRPYP